MSDVRADHPQPGWRLGRIGGVPVYLAPSLLLIAAVIVAMFAPTVREVRPDLGVFVYVVALVYAVALLTSILVHELAHAMAAKATGMQPTEIVLTLWGGHTAFRADGIRPFSSFVVAAVGPFANLALAGIVYGIVRTVELSELTWRLAISLMIANLAVGLFNLLPGLPLDGGAMLEAVVWGVTGRRTLATTIAAWAGMATAAGVLAWALLPILAGLDESYITIIWKLFIAWLLFSGARQALTVAGWRSKAATLNVDSLMIPAVGVPVGTPLGAVAHLAQNAVLVVTQPDEIATPGPVALVDAAAVAGATAAGRQGTAVEMVSSVLADRVPLDVRADGEEMLRRFSDGAQVLVVTHQGAIVGVLRAHDVAAALG